MSTGRIVHTINNSESTFSQTTTADTNLQTLGISFESGSNSYSSENKSVETFVKPELAIPSLPTSSETSTLLTPLSLIKSEPYPTTNLSRIDSPRVVERSEIKIDLDVTNRFSNLGSSVAALRQNRETELRNDEHDLEYLNDCIPKLEEIIKSQTSCVGYASRIDGSVYVGATLATVFGTLWGTLGISSPFSFIVGASLGYCLIGLGSRSKFGYPTVGQILRSVDGFKISETLLSTGLSPYVDNSTRLDTALIALKVKRDDIQRRLPTTSSLGFLAPQNAARNLEQSSKINLTTTPVPR